MVRNARGNPSAPDIELTASRASVLSGILSGLGSFVKIKPLGAVGAVILVIAVFMAVLAPVIATFPPKSRNLEVRSSGYRG